MTFGKASDGTDNLGQPAERQALFGGVGSVKVWDLLGSLNAAPFSAVLYCELAAGGSVGAHRQLYDPEIVIGLEGEAVVGVDGRSHAVRSGGLVHLPLGALLTIENRSYEVAFRYLIIKAHATGSHLPVDHTP